MSAREDPIIYVQMDSIANEYRTIVNQEDGSTSIQIKPFSCSETVPRLVPFVSKPSKRCISSGNLKFHRMQYPIEPAESKTVHTTQGSTEKRGSVLDLPQIYRRERVAYVALSRSPDLTEVASKHMLVREDFTQGRNNLIQTEAEYVRLRAIVPIFPYNNIVDNFPL